MNTMNINIKEKHIISQTLPPLIINKNIIKELNDYLEEFGLTEIEYTEKDIKVKISKSVKIQISR